MENCKSQACKNHKQIALSMNDTKYKQIKWGHIGSVGQIDVDVRS